MSKAAKLHSDSKVYNLTTTSNY